MYYLSGGVVSLSNISRSNKQRVDELLDKGGHVISDRECTQVAKYVQNPILRHHNPQLHWLTNG